MVSASLRSVCRPHPGTSTTSKGDPANFAKSRTSAHFSNPSVHASCQRLKSSAAMPIVFLRSDPLSSPIMQEDLSASTRSGWLRPVALAGCMLASGLFAGAALATGKLPWGHPGDTLLLLLILAGLPALALLSATPAAGSTLSAALAIPALARDYHEDEYRILFDCNPMPMWVFDRKSLRFLAVNDAAVRQYGFSREEFLCMTVLDIRPPACVGQLLAYFSEHSRGPRPSRAWTHRRKDGSLFDAQVVCHDLAFAGAEAMLAAAYDVTASNRAHLAAADAEERYRAIFNNSVLGIFQHSADGRIVRVNPALAHLHGYDSPEQLMAEVPNVAERLFVHPEQLAELARQTERGPVRNAEVELYTRDRRRIWVLVNLRATQDSAGQRYFEGTAEDITDRKAAEAQVRFLAWHDPLTGLPNRALFQDRLQAAVREASAGREQIAVLFLDFDRFQNINDALGHSVGDRVLHAAAQRFLECVEPGDTVARLGGDEFLLLLRHLESRSSAAAVAHNLLHALREPFVVEGHTLRCSCSIGISLFPGHGDSPEVLVSNADAARYSVREAGGSNFRLFSPEMNSRAVAYLTLENHLRAALDAGQFSLAWQPQIDLATGALTGIEALLRWKHPTLGQIPPAEFIPVAESSGLILSIGEWVLRSACTTLQAWRLRGLPVAPAAVNVSALQFLDGRFCSLAQEILSETGLPPDLLEIELTESVLLSTAGIMASALEQLRAMGVRLAIDDFGTGYSSLGYLRQFRAQKLKIDRSFVSNLPENSDDAAIALAIIRMAKSLSLQVVAEGVETEAQMQFLRNHGCDQIQGYLISRPVTAEAMAAFLRESAASQARTASAAHQLIEPLAVGNLLPSH